MKNRKPIPKYVWGALISTGLNAGISAIANNQEKKAQEKERRRQLQIERNNKFTDDKIVAQNFEEEGTYANSFYLRDGGSVGQASPFVTKGGQLDEISSNSSKVLGNAHGQNSIDGVEGVQLDKNGETIAEVENQEIIKNNDMVFSDKLSPNGDKSYAQIAEELSRKKSELEKKIKEPNSTSIKTNTLKREIEKIDIEEDELFKKQESEKEAKGLNEKQPMARDENSQMNPEIMAALAGNVPQQENPAVTGEQIIPKEQTMKIGGNIDPPDDDKKSNKFNKAYIDLQNKMNKYPPAHTIKDRDSLVSGYRNYRWLAGQQGPNDKVNNNSSTSGFTNNSFKTEEFAKALDRPKKLGALKDTTNPRKYKEGGDGVSSGGKGGFAKSAEAVVPYLDNAVNLVNTLTKPKPPKPVLTRKRGQNTEVNVTDQLNNIDQAVERSAGFAKDNSSNSKTARGAVIDARLKGATARNKILANKKNMEVQLENQATGRNTQIDSQNNAKLDRFNNTNLERKLDIRKELSDNAANAVQSYAGVKQYKDEMENIDKNRELMKSKYDLEASGISNRYIGKDGALGYNKNYTIDDTLSLPEVNFGNSVLENFNEKLEFTGSPEKRSKLEEEIRNKYGISLDEYLNTYVKSKS